MANYWCYGVPDYPRGSAFQVPNTPAPVGFSINFKVAYVGSDVPAIGSDSERQGPFVIQDRSIMVELLFADTPAQILAKVTTAIVNDAASIGITVARAGGLIPSFIRGA